MDEHATDVIALAVRRSGWWTGDPTSDEIAAEIMAALNAAGFTILRPITAAEEAANNW